MIKYLSVVSLLCALLALAGLARSQSSPSVVKVKGGLYRPFYPAVPQEKEIPVKDFIIDVFPVTNSQFLEFVKQNPAWQRGKVKKIFADSRYLARWKSPVVLGPQVEADQPVTEVSWFAAKTYCEWKGMRLPRENEWEYVAQATEIQADGRNDQVWRQRVLDWYSKPGSKKLAAVGKSAPNYWGVFDLHGLIWEWVLDFNNALVSSDSREGKDADKSRFCGAGSLVATDKEDYATFMRMAFRGSLKANYTTASLGFRCAGDVYENK